MSFFRKLLGIEDQDNKALINDRFNKLQEKVLAEMAGLREENFRLKATLENKESKINEMVGKLRKQNEADLFLELKRIEKRILDGEKKETIDTTQYDALRNVNASYLAQQQTPRITSLQGLLGGAAGLVSRY